MTTDLPEAARALAPTIAEYADQIDRDRELPRPLVDKMVAAGLFRALMPRSVGGLEVDLPTHLEMVEAVARADASTGWCLNQGAVRASIAAFMTLEGAREIFGDPRVVVANGSGPPGCGQATPVEGGYRVSGRWGFASGSRHATWLGGTCSIVEDGRPRIGEDGKLQETWALFPAKDAELVDTWQVSGLRGTGSFAVVVSDLFVPTAHTAWQGFAPPREPNLLYLLPTTLLFASGFSAVALGTARGALDAFKDLAASKTPRQSRSLLRDDPLARYQYGQAEAHLAAARRLLMGTARETSEALAASGKPTLEQRAYLRLAATHGIHLAKQALDIVYQASGASAVFNAGPFRRRFQDMHVITQHTQGRLAHYESVATALLGLEPETRSF